MQIPSVDFINISDSMHQEENKYLSKRYHYEVATSSGLKKNLLYYSDQKLAIGQLVRVPLRSSQTNAVILKKNSNFKNNFPLRKILSVYKHLPCLSTERIHWLTWLSNYYQHPLGEVIHLSYPSFITKITAKTWNKKLQIPDNPSTQNTTHKLLKLTSEQKSCIQKICKLAHNKFQVHFIYGVTGSGKTEVFFRLIESAIQKKQTALILVPEISLTPQHIERFSIRFPGQVACLHSGMTAKQKATEWAHIIQRTKTILIGPRSALFCPIPNLAWIILDEEHEPHFKQEEKLKYHARDAAIMLGKKLNIPTVLASATPSMESWQNIQTGKYSCYQLTNRVFKTVPPKIELIDMRKKVNSPNKNLPWWLSPVLFTALKKTLQKKEQAALFINRRGEASCVLCPQCGFHFNCSNCDIALTQHQSHHLVCHYCNWREEKPDKCPQCEWSSLSTIGLGTAIIEKEILKLFPSAKLIRADRDEIQNHKDWTECIRKIENKEIDIVVGTQMIAKGLDFPHLSLVGVILADQDLRRPDFRSSERSFQLMIQMAGRAGRRSQTGRVILQSYYPDHPVLQSLIKGNYEQFAEQELAHRKQYHYPPYVKLILVRVQGKSENHTLEATLRIKDRIQRIKELNLLGPARPIIFRLRNKYRYHLLLKSKSLSILQQASQQIQAISTQLPSSVQIHINQDPAYIT